ncbi:deoxyhypusine synthase family protein [Magnetofaba australis]|uniref:Putative deoxyhypusine synthase n=1 Tax=Magnetofaba australis IT-1 TaxID=1434232 RepID=A0A1Y2K032_9PROT|nr:deoxyhypusine synthase family protein [Magnetofaba australis]OSM00103.1 putative deoxyhypusine synthase [Magnetofaba australis IT-1]
MQVRDQSNYHSPETDNLKPVKPLDLAQIDSVSELLAAMADASFGARRLGQAASVLESMVRDPDCFTVLTLSGAMTVAKMGLVIVEMIERGYVDAIISTGALMTHGLVETQGRHHYKYAEGMDDKTLYERGYNRVYDTLEPESNLDEAEKLVSRVLRRNDLPEVLSSRSLTQLVGRELAESQPGARGPLPAAYARDVPILIPAFTDSEMGLDFSVNNHRRQRNGLAPLPYDPFLDLDFYLEQIKQTKRLGIFTIGGGVPRNYAQQVGPYAEIMAHRLGEKEVEPIRFQYGVRICPDPSHLGGLSGCTYSEGVSWGKFVPESDGGRYAEVLTDATIAWPLVVKAVMERAPRKAGMK